MTVVKNIFDAPPLGIDLDGTIDEAPNFFKLLTTIWPGKVYIITYRNYKLGAIEDARRCGVTKIDDVILAKSLEHKAEIIRDLGIKIYVDDQDECLMDIDKDVIVLKIRNEGNFEYGSKRWLYSERTGKEV